MELQFRRKGQGLIARFVGGGLLALLIAFGCVNLSQSSAMNSMTANWWGQLLFLVPFFEFEIQNGDLISLGLFLLGCFGVYVFVVNHPEVSKFLIETEGEMRKVSWPESGEFINASIVVLLSIILITLYLFVLDLVFVRFSQMIGILVP